MKKMIEIHRAPNHTNLPDDVYDLSKQRIGSAWHANGQIATGLNEEEIKKYMPQILGIAESATTFYRDVQQYFAEKRVDVPREGAKLNIAFNGEEPVNILDYINYKFVSMNPFVAPSEEAFQSRHRFYLKDLAKQKELAKSSTAKRMKAMQHFITAQADETVLDQILLLLHRNPRKMDHDDKVIELEKFVTAEPENYLEMVDNTDLEMTSFVTLAVDSELITKAGNTLFFGEIELGDSIAEAVKFLKAKTNSQTLQTLRARAKMVTN